MRSLRIVINQEAGQQAESRFGQPVLVDRSIRRSPRTAAPESVPADQPAARLQFFQLFLD
jgi:hypothetical protein